MYLFLLVLPAILLRLFLLFASLKRLSQLPHSSLFQLLLFLHLLLLLFLLILLLHRFYFIHLFHQLVSLLLLGSNEGQSLCFLLLVGLFGQKLGNLHFVISVFELIDTSAEPSHDPTYLFYLFLEGLILLLVVWPGVG